MYQSTIKSFRFNLNFTTYFLICMFVAYYMLEIGLIGVAIGVVVMTYQSLLILDVENGRYRKSSKILGYETGKWRHLPPIKYVTVVRVLAVTGRNEDGIVEDVDYQYRLMLAVEDKLRVIKLGTFDLGVALEEAMKIGDALDLKVYDCSSSDKKWIR